MHAFYNDFLSEIDRVVYLLLSQNFLVFVSSPHGGRSVVRIENLGHVFGLFKFRSLEIMNRS